MTVMENTKSTVFFEKAFSVCMSFVLSRSIYAVTKLQVAEALLGNTLSIGDLSKKLGLKYADQLERVMNFLVSNNIFAKNERGYFEHTVLSQDLLWSQKGKKIMQFQDERWHLLGDETQLEALDFSEKLGLDGQFILARAVHIACKLGSFKDVVNKKEISPYLQKA
ncbi:MAG: hypothetical protein LLF94_10725, partial [Chlamydiales bacterium]|nr:hypothetical protein [Chlamydiales bacterium]